MNLKNVYGHDLELPDALSSVWGGYRDSELVDCVKIDSDSLGEERKLWLFQYTKPVQIYGEDGFFQVFVLYEFDRTEGSYVRHELGQDLTMDFFDSRYDEPGDMSVFDYLSSSGLGFDDIPCVSVVPLWPTVDEVPMAFIKGIEIPPCRVAGILLEEMHFLLFSLSSERGPLGTIYRMRHASTD